MKRTGIALVLAGALAGCGGGAAPLTPAAPPASGQSQAVKGTGAIPARSPAATAARARPQYVSPSAVSAGITVNGGKVQAFDISPGSTLCTGVAARTCVLPVVAPLGNDTFLVQLYDAANLGGNVLSGGSITANVSTSTSGLTVNLLGTVHSIQLALASATIVPRTPSTTTLTVKALDADGNTITGGYASPISLKSTDASGSISVSPSSVTSSTTAVTVSYSGSTLVFGGGTIVASAGGVTPANAPAAAIASTTPCAPTFTPTNLYVSWDIPFATFAGANVYKFAPPYTGAPTILGPAVINPVFMSIDPAGHILFAQANTTAYPAFTANVVYSSAPYTATPVSVTPSSFEIYGVAADDRGDLFLAEPAAGVFEAAGPLPTVGNNYGTPAVLPNSPASAGGVLVDKYCNLFVNGNVAGTNYVDIFGTTGQPGGGYGSIAPLVNTTLTGSGGLGLDSAGDLFVGTNIGLDELKPPYTGNATVLPITIGGAAITSVAVDTNGNVLFADYGNDNIDETSPPYTTFTTVNAGTLDLAAGVVVGP